MLEWAAKSNIDVVHFVRMNSIERVLALQDVSYTDAKGNEQNVPWRLERKEAEAYFTSRPPPGLGENAPALNTSEFVRKIVSEHQKVARFEATLAEAAEAYGLRYTTVTYEELAGTDGDMYAERLKAFLGVYGCSADATAKRRDQEADHSSVKMHPVYIGDTDEVAQIMPTAMKHAARCVDRVRPTDMAELKRLLRDSGGAAIELCESFVIGDPRHSDPVHLKELKRRLFNDELNQPKFRHGAATWT